MCNKVQSEQCFAVTSAKSVASFQASLKWVREEARAKLSSRGNKCWTSYGSKCLCEGGAANKNDINLEIMGWFEALLWWWSSKQLK